jgi:hypothetical protein
MGTGPLLEGLNNGFIDTTHQQIRHGKPALIAMIALARWATRLSGLGYLYPPARRKGA